MAPAAAWRVEKRRGKRAAEEELDGERRLRKTFDRLKIEKISDHAATATTPTATPIRGRGDGAACSSSDHTAYHAGGGDGMQVDDTKTRVFITDLAEEIAEIEAEERKSHLKFMPEMEKEMMSVPKSVLSPKAKTEEPKNNELVLYRVPAALGIPAEKDVVRLAMTDARERAREKMTAQIHNKRQKADDSPCSTPSSMAIDDEQGERSPVYDFDPMDIDN